MSAQDAIEWDDSRVRASGPADTRVAPKWYDFSWDATRASAEQAYWDTPGRAQDTRNSDILSAAAALTELNGRSITRYQIIPVGEPGGVPIVNETQFWRDLADLRRTRPDALADFAKDKADYDARLNRRFQSGTAQRAERMAQGGLLGNLAGGIVGSFTDPITVATLPLGGWGKSAAMKILSEGTVQAGVQVLETPALYAERAQQGGELTASEAGWNILLAGLGGGAFKGAELGVGKVGSKAWKATEDARSALALQFAKPEAGLSPDQMAALHILSRSADVDASNPFMGTYENLEAHARRIDETLAAMARWPEPSTVQAVPSIARPAGRAMGALRVDFENAWRAIIGNEGGTARDGSFLTSPAGAIGPAQVMPGTAPEAARLAGLPWDEARYRSDHAYNVALGQAYYRDLLRQFDNDPVKAAAAYNAGPGSIRRGTGLRGAMERARRAGVPDEWVSFLPAETRKYVENFRRRTGMQAGEAIDGALPTFDADGAPARSPDLDAERPLVDVPDRADIAAGRGADLPDMPELRRDLFGNDHDWRMAQAEVDAEAFGSAPSGGSAAFEVGGAVTREPLVDNHLVDMSEHADRLWREMEPRKAEQFLPTGNASYDAHTNHELFFSDNPDLALGQGSNRGVLMEFDAAGLRGKVSTSKPAWELGYEKGTGSEYLVRSISGDPYRKNLRAVRIVKDAQLDKISRSRLSRSLDEMERQGWRRTEADGYVQYERPSIFSLEEAPLSLRDADLELGSVRDELEAQRVAGPVVPDAEVARVFDDPGGDAVGRVADLAWHDAQMTAAKYQGAEQLTFDLGDGRGERSIAEIEAELKADDDAISTIEGCLAPAPLGGAA